MRDATMYEAQSESWGVVMVELTVVMVVVLLLVVVLLVVVLFSS